MEELFEVRLDYSPASTGAGAALQSLGVTIRYLEELDRYFVETLNGPNLTSITLEKVEVGSIRLLLKNVLTSVDDEDIKNKGLIALWRALLIKFKHLAIRYLSEENFTKSDFIAGARQLSREANARLDDEFDENIYVVLDRSVTEIARTVRAVGGEARLTYIAPALPPVAIFPSGDFDDRISEPEPDAGVRTEQHKTNWRLIIKKPDLLGNSKWEFRHEGRSLHASLKDKNWLEKFHKNRLSISPGDIMLCLVETTMYYEKGRLIDSKHEILKVNRIEKMGPEELQQSLIE